MSDEVRFLVGDTDAKKPFLQDEEIAYVLAKTNNDVDDAAVQACINIISQLSRLCDQTVGSVSKSYSQMRAGYMDTLALLRRNASGQGGAPYVGGISRSDSRLLRQSPDRVKPLFDSRRGVTSGRRQVGLSALLGQSLYEGDCED